jgi:hypothetical protein
MKTPLGSKIPCSPLMLEFTRSHTSFSQRAGITVFPEILATSVVVTVGQLIWGISE